MATAVAVVSLVTTVVGAGVTYVQQRKAAKAQEAAAEYNAQVMRNQARQTEDAAAANFSKMQDQKRRRLAAARANAAGSGMTFTGSVLQSHLAGADRLEQDIQSQVWNAQSAARGQRSQADMQIYEGSMRASATRTNANASLLSSAGSIGQKGYNLSQTFGKIPTRLS